MQAAQHTEVRGVGVFIGIARVADEIVISHGRILALPRRVAMRAARGYGKKFARIALALSWWRHCCDL